jgi:hypothetical protein
LNRHDGRKGALFEHRFWLQILGDHARFMFATTSPKEVAEVQREMAFIQIFDKLLEQARNNLSESQTANLTQHAYIYAKEFREFKLHLLNRHLTGEIAIGLSPTFFNHMLNELDEYLRVLKSLMEEGCVPVYHPIHHHLLWLPDAVGHAGAIHDFLDAVEMKLRKKSKKFEKHFQAFYLKAVEVAGYMRTNLTQFPALSRLNKESELEMKLFVEFLKEIEALDLSGELLDTLSPLMPDHMAREEYYYLTKLAQVSEVEMPAGDPTKPRVDG